MPKLASDLDIHFDLALVLLEENEHSPAAEELEIGCQAEAVRGPGTCTAGSRLSEYQSHFAGDSAVSDISSAGS